MIYLLTVLVLAAAACLLPLVSQPRETKLVLCADIGRPASAVFEIVCDSKRILAWQRLPRWLPGPLRLSNLSPWGEHIRSRNRVLGKGGKLLPEIRIRCLPDREFGYQLVHGPGLNCQSTFHLIPDEGKCLLIWEIRYQARRLPDILGRALIADAARASMSASLEYIRRLALSRPERIFAHAGLYLDHGGQLPAA